jgi:hypothetical protein
VQTAVRDEPSVQRESPIVSPERAIIGSQERGIIAVRDVSSNLAPTPRLDTRRSSVKRSARPSSAVVRPPAATRPAPRGMLDRLRLGWLRHAFSARSSL